MTLADDLHLAGHSIPYLTDVVARPGSIAGTRHVKGSAVHEMRVIRLEQNSVSSQI
jgi:hypothetical protein